MLSPGVVEIANGFGITVSLLNHSTAFLILTLAISLFITNPVAKKWGKRPIYIVSISIMLASSCWAGAAQGYPSFEGSRILSGFGMAPFEVLVQATLSDLYSVHQRATRIAVWNLFLLTGIAGGSLVSGYIIQDLTYRWTFWICAIFFGVLVVAVIFVVPETSYRRTGGGFMPATEQKILGVEEDEKGSVRSYQIPKADEPYGKAVAHAENVDHYTSDKRMS
jgi:MFS family permease